MKYRILMTLPTLAFALTLVGCSTSSKDDNPLGSPTKIETGASIEAKQAGAQIGTALVTEIRFEKGKTTFAGDDAEKIAKGIERARKSGNVKRADIVTWADAELPADGAPDLGKDAIRLADARAEVLAKDLENRLPELKTNAINMAKRTGGLKKFLKTKDARIQEALEIAGIPREGAKNGDAEPKASRAIIIFSTEAKN